MKNALVISRLPLYGISYSKIGYDISHMLWNNGYYVEYIGFSSTPNLMSSPFYYPFKILNVPESIKYIDKHDKELFSKLTKPDIIIVIEDIICAPFVKRLKNYFSDIKTVMYTMFDGLHLSNFVFVSGKYFSIEEMFSPIDKIITPTMFSYNQFIDNSIPSSKIDILPLYFDEYSYMPLDIPKGTQFIIQNVARNTYRKNIGNLILAINELKKYDIVLRLRTELRTPDPTSIDIIGMLKKMKLENHILFEQYSPLVNTNEDDLIISYNTIHLGVYPSAREGWGMPCLETMACGTPIIVTEKTAMDSWVPSEMPRFKSSGSIVSGGFTSTEEIVTHEEIIDKVLYMYDLWKKNDKLFDPTFVRSLVCNMSKKNFEKKFIEIIS